MINRSLLKDNAKKTLNRGYWSCVLTALVLAVATGGFGGGSTGSYKVNNTSNSDGGVFGGYMYGSDLSSIMEELNIPIYLMGTLVAVMIMVFVVSFLVAIFLLQPLEVGCRKFFIDARSGDFRLGDIGEAFSSSYMNIVKIMLLRWLYTLLWTLLFIIPGIIKSYEYRMIPYILAEEPDISAEDAFARSRQMMYGSKFDAFVFDLSFLLWFILDVFTLGIAGIFYINPYYANACAELYAFIKAKAADGYSNYDRSGQSSYGPAGYGYTDPSDPYANQGNPYGNQGDPYAGQGNPYSDEGASYGENSRDDRGYYSGQTGTIGQSDASNSSGSGRVSADDAKPFNRPYGE